MNFFIWVENASLRSEISDVNGKRNRSSKRDGAEARTAQFCCQLRECAGVDRRTDLSKHSCRLHHLVQLGLRQYSAKGIQANGFVFFFFRNDAHWHAAVLHGVDRLHEQLSEQDHPAIGRCQLLVSVADLSLRRLADVVLPPYLPSV